MSKGQQAILNENSEVNIVNLFQKNVLFKNNINAKWLKKLSFLQLWFDFFSCWAEVTYRIYKLKKCDEVVSNGF